MNKSFMNKSFIDGFTIIVEKKKRYTANQIIPHMNL